MLSLSSESRSHAANLSPEHYLTSLWKSRGVLASGDGVSLCYVTSSTQQVDLSIAVPIEPPNRVLIPSITLA